MVRGLIAFVCLGLLASAAPVTTLSYTSGNSAAARSVAFAAWSDFESNLLSNGLSLLYEEFENGPWTTGGQSYASGGVSVGPNVSSRYYNTAVNTPFGSWSVNGLAGQGDSSRTSELVVLKSGNSPFGGRFNTTSGGQHWLDSNDVTSILFTPSQPLTALGFLVSDFTDQGATFNVTFQGGGSLNLTSTVNPPKADGSLAFVGILADASDPITSVTFFNTGSNIRADGFGLDSFVAGVPVRELVQTPEPGTYALVGTALIGLFLLRRKRS